jgi:hypothetical protein
MEDDNNSALLQHIYNFWERSDAGSIKSGDHILHRKCRTTRLKNVMWLVEISCQETNAEIQDLFSFCIEGTDNNVAQQIPVLLQL